MEEKHKKQGEEKVRKSFAAPKQEFKKSEENSARLIRILGTDIPGNKGVYAGLTRIKGVSWGYSNAVCVSLNINKNKKIQDLSEDEMKKIIDFLKNGKLPEFMLNSRKDFNTGMSRHIFGSDLDLKREFDIKRLKKIRSYKGLRHALGQKPFQKK